MTLRVRFAPSPTGWLHVGTLRTVLYDFILAQQQKGTFVFRNEDTDQARKVERGSEGIREVMNYLGLIPTEGEDIGGEYGPYTQSQRLDIYTKHADQLLAEGKAYCCFCSKERLDEVRAQQKAAKQNIKYDGHCRALSAEEAQAKVDAGESFVIRQLVPETGLTSYTDVIYGKISFKNNDLDDQVLIKSDGYPTYNYANVIDDHLMEITHVLRGDEFLSSTPKHVLIYQAFGWEPPTFAHLPMVLNPDGKGKLSKRKASVSVLNYLRQGYCAEAIFNFLALLGWTPSPEHARQDEFYSLQFLIEHFTLERINKKGARFDPVKLLAFNGNWLRSFSVEEVVARLDQWIEKVVLPNWVEDEVKGVSEETETLRSRVKKLQAFRTKNESQFTEALALVHTRARTLSEIVEQLEWLYNDTVTYDKQVLSSLPPAPAMNEVIVNLSDKLNQLSSWDQEPWETAVRSYADGISWKHGDLFMLLRWAMTGSKFSPPLRELMVILGKERSLERIRNINLT